MDLLQNILWFGTAHGWRDPHKHFASLQIMLDHTLMRYPNLLSTDSDLMVAQIVSAVNALQNNTYSLFLFLHFLVVDPDLVHLCLDTCHDRNHTLAFIRALIDFIRREFNGPRGWVLFDQTGRSTELLQESAPSTVTAETEEKNESDKEKKPAIIFNPQCRVLHQSTDPGCELDRFVQNCRNLWIDTATPRSLELFGQTGQ